MWYAAKFDEASWNLLLQIGITRSYLAGSGKGMAAVEQVTTFKRELMAGDCLGVTTELVEMRERVVRFLHTMRNAETGEECATCAVTGVHVDMATRKACPFPDALRAMGQDLLDGARAAAA